MTDLLASKVGHARLVRHGSALVLRFASLRWFLLPGTAVLSGCATYRALPLDSAAVNLALEPVSIERVKVDAAKLEHPLLKPLLIDGRDGLTPDEVAVMAAIASPQLRALRDRRGVARAQVIQAGLLPNPQLAYALDRPTTPGYIDAKTLGLGWEVTALFGYRDRVASARATSAALDLGVAWQEWQVAQDARLHAFRVLSLEVRVPLAREVEDDLADARDLAREALALGQRTAADLAAVFEAWSAAQNARFALEQELATERFALNLALGQPANTSIRLKAGAEVPELPESARSATELLRDLEKRRLDLVALATGYKSAEASLRAAIKAQFPKISLNFSRANDTSDVRTRGFGVTVDLPLFDRNQGQIAAGTATRQQLFDEYLARVAEARSTVFQILSNLHAVRIQLQTLEAGLPELEKLAAALDQAMATRNSDAQAWRDAHGALLARRSERARLRQDVFELGVALEIATGRPLLTDPAFN